LLPLSGSSRETPVAAQGFGHVVSAGAVVNRQVGVPSALATATGQITLGGQGEKAVLLLREWAWPVGGTRVIGKSYQAMRAITIMTTAAGALAAGLVFAPSAKAERICRQACDQAGFCQSVCVEDDHVFLDNDDKDFYLRHGRPDAFLGR
jgi:hypothetical protein